MHAHVHVIYNMYYRYILREREREMTVQACPGSKTFNQKCFPLGLCECLPGWLDYYDT